MTPEKFVDPRLIAKEPLFAKLHSVNFEVLSHISSIQQYVIEHQSDITEDNADWIAVCHLYDMSLENTEAIQIEMQKLIDATAKMRDSDVALAEQAQVMSSGIQSMQLWQILGEIPEDLLDVDEVSATLKERFMQHLSMWHKYFYGSPVSH